MTRPITVEKLELKKQEAVKKLAAFIKHTGRAPNGRRPQAKSQWNVDDEALWIEIAGPVVRVSRYYEWFEGRLKEAITLAQAYLLEGESKTVIAEAVAQAQDAALPADLPEVYTDPGVPTRFAAVIKKMFRSYYLTYQEWPRTLVTQSGNTAWDGRTSGRLARLKYTDITYNQVNEIFKDPLKSLTKEIENELLQERAERELTQARMLYGIIPPEEITPVNYTEDNPPLMGNVTVADASSKHFVKKSEAPAPRPLDNPLLKRALTNLWNNRDVLDKYRDDSEVMFFLDLLGTVMTEARIKETT